MVYSATIMQISEYFYLAEAFAFLFSVVFYAVLSFRILIFVVPFSNVYIPTYFSCRF